MIETSQETFIAEIEETLDALLTQIQSGRVEPRRGDVIMTADEFCHPDRALEALLDDPAGQGCRRVIHELGEHLLRLTGSEDAMREVAERVADRHPRLYGHRLNILDKWWSGIGAWVA